MIAIIGGTSSRGRCRSPGLLASSVVGNDFQGREVQSVHAADVDRGGRRALAVRAHAEGRAAAVGAKMVLDMMLVERVGPQVRLGGAKPQLVARREPEQVPLLGADRAVALEHLLDFSLDIEGYASAMTAAVVCHDPLSSPSLWYSFRLSLFH